MSRFRFALAAAACLAFAAPLGASPAFAAPTATTGNVLLDGLAAQLDHLRVEMHLSPKQEQAFDRFEAAMMKSAHMIHDHAGMGMSGPMSASDSMAMTAHMETMRLEASEMLLPTVTTLEEGLTAQQRQVFNEVMNAPMGAGECSGLLCRAGY